MAYEKPCSSCALGIVSLVAAQKSSIGNYTVLANTTYESVIQLPQLTLSLVNLKNIIKSDEEKISVIELSKHPCYLLQCKICLPMLKLSH